MDKIDSITRTLQHGVSEQVFPGAVLFVRHNGTIRYHHAVGFASQHPAKRQTSIKTIYDLASLTKPLATGTGILCLVQDGQVGIDQPIGSILQDLHGKPIAKATIRDLLCHRSGLPGWRPYYEAVTLQKGMLPKEEKEPPRSHMRKQIAQEPLEYEPRTKSVYSDLGFILLGFAIEAVTQRSLSQFCFERIFHPLHTKSLIFSECLTHCDGFPSNVAPTRRDPWRGRMLWGEVDDNNAYILNGIAGHAGLFGTAEAVSVVTKAWLDSYHDHNAFLNPKLVRQFVTRQKEPKESSWVLGWDTPSYPSSSGAHFSPSAFGHLGFTGTSIWIDPEVELEVILLSNRVNPTPENNKIREFRPMIHDVIYREVVRIGQS